MKNFFDKVTETGQSLRFIACLATVHFVVAHVFPIFYD